MVRHPIPASAVSILWGTATLLALGTVVCILIVAIRAIAC